LLLLRHALCLISMSAGHPLLLLLLSGHLFAVVRQVIALLELLLLMLLPRVQC
jgi:hypothetical protein